MCSIGSPLLVFVGVDFDSPISFIIISTQQQNTTYNYSFVQIGTNWCKDSGIYEFTMGASGAVVRARYSFVYVFEDGQWKIAHHHSSQMPESIQPKQPTLSDQEVRGLFNVSVLYKVYWCCCRRWSDDRTLGCVLSTMMAF